MTLLFVPIIGHLVFFEFVELLALQGNEGFSLGESLAQGHVVERGIDFVGMIGIAGQKERIA